MKKERKSSSRLVIEELCTTCGEPLVVVRDKTLCPKCQPNLSFVVGYESATRYSYTRVDPRSDAPKPMPAAPPSRPTPMARRRTSKATRIKGHKKP